MTLEPTRSSRTTRTLHTVLCLLLVPACTRGTTATGHGEGATFGAVDDDGTASTPSDDDGASSESTSTDDTDDDGAAATSTGGDPTLDPSTEGATDPGTTTGDPTDADDTSTTSDPTTSTTDDTDDTTSPVGEPVDLSGWVLVQTDSARELELPAGTLVPAGGFLVVGRDASAGDFADFWGITWADDTVYVDSDEQLPVLNGAETFTLRMPGGALVDGPSIALTAGTALARVDADTLASSASAWEVIASPSGGATPGSGPDIGGAQGVPYLAEIADATGNGNFVYEFVELRVAP